MKLKYIVKSNDNYSNLKELLKLQFEMSDRLLLKLKRNCRIIVNGLQVPPNITVKTNDIIEIDLDFLFCFIFLRKIYFFWQRTENSLETFFKKVLGMFS